MRRRRMLIGLVLGVTLAVTGCEAETSTESSLKGVEPTPSATPSVPEYDEWYASAVPTPAASATRPVPTVARKSPAPRRTAVAVLLYAAAGGDGDSWKDTQGREYRMGLVNTPEYNECYGRTATAKRKELVRNGFRAKTYTSDNYGRRVSVITLPDGTNLNVWMARQGYANDKYLDAFRHENPTLAAQLDTAFAAAKRDKAGLWGACSSSSSNEGSTSGGGGSSGSCHPDYVTCIPVKGDGSGNGAENDLDCGDIGKKVQLRRVGVDPYRLDADGDGYGCDSY